jgi:biopolymer transport protein TolR
MSMFAGLRKGRDAEMNVTPLIDVLLVLLIIFMVMQPNRQLGERAEIPQPTLQAAIPPDGAIVVQLQDQGVGSRPALRVNSEDISWSDLERRLRKIYGSRADRTAFVTGDPEIEFQSFAEALDITHRAGADRVGLMKAR